MKVLVNGVGNIGTTLANLLSDFKEILNISTVYVYKNTLQTWKVIDLSFLEKKGVKIIYSQDTSLSAAVAQVDYVFEATANGIGLKNKAIYEAASHLIGVCSQGSEKGFGVPFMSSLNDRFVANHKFVQVVSCNTHGAASIISTLADTDLVNLNHADFVVVRRSEDLGNHERLVGANVLARHLSTDYGTHHAIDVHDMYKTMDIDCPISSSDITTPSQLMHSTRFHLSFKSNIDLGSILDRLHSNPFIATTQKFDSNEIFELGRRYGKYGRIYNHCIVNSNNLLLTENSIKGWAFVPQEGNSIISTIHAFLIQVKGYENSIDQIDTIKRALLQPEF